jgi:hypothetical protein
MCSIVLCVGTAFISQVLPIEVDGSTSSQPATPQLQPETHGVESPVQAKFNNGKNSRRSSVQSRSRNSVSGGDGGSSVQLLTEQQDLTGAAYDASTASSLIENVVAGGSGSPYTDRAVLLDLWTHARGSLSVSDALDVTDLTMPTTKININKNSKNHNTGNNNAVNAAASPTVLPLGFEKTFAPASLLLVLPTQWRAPPGVGLANTKRNTQSNGIENHSGLTKNNSVSGGSEDDTGSIETKSLGLSWDDLAAPLGELWGVTVGLLPHHQEEVDNHHLGEQLHSEGDHHVSGSETAHANNNDHHAHSHHKHHHHSTSHHQRHAPSPKEDPLRVVSVHLDGWNLCGHLPQDSLHYLNAMQELELPHNELAGEVNSKSQDGLFFFPYCFNYLIKNYTYRDDAYFYGVFYVLFHFLPNEHSMKRIDSAEFGASARPSTRQFSVEQLRGICSKNANCDCARARAQHKQSSHCYRFGAHGNPSSVSPVVKPWVKLASAAKEQQRRRLELSQ